MPMLEFLNPDSVVPTLRARDKKHVLQELAGHSARRLSGLSDRDIFETARRVYRPVVGGKPLGPQDTTP